MGVYQSVYLGAFMSVASIDGTTSETITKCTNPDCKCRKRLDTKYCPECGSKIIPEVVTKPSKVSPIDFDEDWYDTFCFPHNGGTEIDKNTRDEALGSDLSDEVGGFGIEDDKAAKAKQAFITKYATWIDQIKAAGGEPKIEYGIFIHYA